MVAPTEQGARHHQSRSAMAVAGGGTSQPSPRRRATLTHTHLGWFRARCCWSCSLELGCARDSRGEEGAAAGGTHRRVWRRSPRRRQGAGRLWQWLSLPPTAPLLQAPKPHCGGPTRKAGATSALERTVGGLQPTEQAETRGMWWRGPSGGTWVQASPSGCRGQWGVLLSRPNSKGHGSATPQAARLSLFVVGTAMGGWLGGRGECGSAALTGRRSKVGPSRARRGGDRAVAPSRARRRVVYVDRGGVLSVGCRRTHRSTSPLSTSTAHTRVSARTSESLVSLAKTAAGAVRVQGNRCCHDRSCLTVREERVPDGSPRPSSWNDQRCLGRLLRERQAPSSWLTHTGRHDEVRRTLGEPAAAGVTCTLLG